MRHVRDLRSLHLDGCALTIGSFDGVHLGHQALMRCVVDEAHKQGVPAVVLTFYPHPSVVLQGRPRFFYISTPDEKAALLGELGADLVITQRFDRELSRMPAGEFLHLLQDHLGMRTLCIGEDFALGHQRQGDRSFLEKSGREMGFEVRVVPPVKVGGQVVSSSRVRAALRAGDVTSVARYLGRPFVLAGTVVEGAGRGRSLGFPTANLRIWQERAFPGPGVYACFARLSEERYKAVANIGVRPTFEQRCETPVVEAHLLDYEGDIYGKELSLAFVSRLRDERRFPGPEALLEQIQKDARRAREVLNRAEEEGDV